MHSHACTRIDTKMLHNPPKHSTISLLLRIAAAVTLIARGWLFLRWDCPYRALFWHEEWMTKPVEAMLHLEWVEYGMTSDPYITFFMQACGAVLMLIGFICLIVRSHNTRMNDLLLLATALLMLFSFSAWLEKDWQLGMLIEHSLQTFCPLFLWLHLRWPLPQRPLLIFIQIATALTFVGHGLYAIGHHPIPAEFVTMSMNVLNMSEDSAKYSLLAAGWLDFAVAIGIFLPWYRIRIFCLYYMVSWGFLTAIARMISHYHPAEKFYGFDPWLVETLVRSSHWLIPLVLILINKKENKSQLIHKEMDTR